MRGGDELGQQEAARLASEQAALPKVESKERGSSRSASVGWSGAGQASGVARKRAREGGRENERTGSYARGWDGMGRESVVTAEKPKGEWGKGGGFEIAHERESGSERGIEPKGKTRANRRASESERAPREERDTPTA